jgi:hypothetical protein
MVTKPKTSALEVELEQAELTLDSGSLRAIESGPGMRVRCSGCHSHFSFQMDFSVAKATLYRVGTLCSLCGMGEA